MKASKQPQKAQDKRAHDGAIIEWQLWDEKGEPCIRDLSRKQARELKSVAGGFIAKVVRAH